MDQHDLETQRRPDIEEVGRILGGLKLEPYTDGHGVNHGINWDMYLWRHLTPAIAEKYKDVRTSKGFSLHDLVLVAFKNPDSVLGIYTGDAETYKTFAEIIDPIIFDYHGFDVSKNEHPMDMDPSKVPMEDLDPSGQKILSVRMRCGRNLNDFAFPPAIKVEDRPALIEKVTSAFGKLEGDLSGQFFPLEGMSDAVRDQLVSDHFLFRPGDRFMETGLVNRDWPKGRGIFHSENKEALCWVGEEDTMRIIAMEKGGNIGRIFERWSRLATKLGNELNFAFDKNRGFLTTCASNIGTGVRLSAHIKLGAALANDEKKIKEICNPLGLAVRGTDGEHTASKGGVYDISNKVRLGKSEVQIAQEVVQGLKELMAEDAKLGA